MRVIGGEFRSRVLQSVPGVETRPTPDRLREALFNVLSPRIEGAIFVDAYAGTGAVGIEALSRGAARAMFIETSRDAKQIIKENLSSLGLEGRATILPGKSAKYLKDISADIVFLDPPYALEREYGVILDTLGKNPPPLVVVQHATRFRLLPGYGKLSLRRTLKQGDNSLSFYAGPDSPEDPNPTIDPPLER